MILLCLILQPEDHTWNHLTHYCDPQVCHRAGLNTSQPQIQTLQWTSPADTCYWSNKPKFYCQFNTSAQSLVIKERVFKNEGHCNESWPTELFLVVSRAGRWPGLFFISALHSPQAAVVNARERLSCHWKERQKDEFRKHILKIRFLLQELSNLQHG